MPVIKHFDGNCHVYVYASADLDMALRILSTPSANAWVCAMPVRACWCIAMWRPSFPPARCRRVQKHNLLMHADPTAMKYLPKAVAATEADWSEEYLGPEISIAVVDDLAGCDLVISIVLWALISLHKADGDRPARLGLVASPVISVGRRLSGRRGERQHALERRW